MPAGDAGFRAAPLIMNERIRLGVVNPETWDFFHDLYRWFAATYRTSLFEARRVRLPLFRGRVENALRRRDLARFLSRNHVVFFEWASSLLAEASTLPRSAAVVTRLHRWEMYHWAHRIDWDAVDRIIVVSEAKRAEFLTRFPQQGHKLHVIPEFIDCGRFPFRKRPFSGTVGILCHLSPRKRVYELILSFSELRRHHPELRLSIGGDVHPAHSDYYRALRSLTDRLGLDGAVRFEGYIDNPADWYAKIDIFVSHSYSEGLQVSPIEAMACGCYTLAHRWEGADELLPDDCLYYTDRELQEKISRYCGLGERDREEQAERMRAIAVGRFDIGRHAPKIQELVDQCARGR